MGSFFPSDLDTFPLPTSANKLNDIPHAELHSSTSLGVEAVQQRVGVTGSAVATTIDYELHNVEHGHDHDGTNSRPVALGPAEDGSATFSDGYFTDLSSSSRIGGTIDRINRTLNSLTVSGSNIAFESQGVSLTEAGTRVNLSGSGVSGSVSGSSVTYTIPGLDYKQLNLLAEGGPFESFLSGMYHEFSYESRVYVSSSTWYEDNTKAKKIVEKIYQRNTKKQATQINYKVYQEDGISVKTEFMDLITYNGAVETNRTRVLI